MTESLKEVIAKLKQQQNSQVSQVKPAPAPIKQEIPASTVDEDEEMEEEVEETLKASSPAPKLTAEEQIAMEIEMLQNNGRFRAELLNQLQEINKALIVIAGVLVDQNGKKS